MPRDARPGSHMTETTRIPGSIPGPVGRSRGSRIAILVLGMHRSGTSALTRMISLLGADLPANLMPAREQNNETGFWESEDVRRINDILLTSMGSAWDDWRDIDLSRVPAEALSRFRNDAGHILARDFASSPLFVLKDPRICRLAPFWVDVLRSFDADVCCVLPIRNPVEVAVSLKRRDGLDERHSHALWLRHVLDAERHTRELPRILLRYEDLLTGWHAEAERIGRVLDLPLSGATPATASAIDGFLRPALRHHAVDAAHLAADETVAGWIKATYEGLAALLSEPGAVEGLTQLDAIRRSFDEADHLLGPVWALEYVGRRTAEATLRRVRVEHEQLEKRRSALQADVTRLTDALSYLERERGKLVEQRDILTKHRETLEAQRNALQGQRDALQTQRDNLQNQRSALQTQRDTLQGQRDALRAHSRQIALQAETLRGELEGERNRLATLRRENERLERAQAATQVALVQLRTRNLTRWRQHLALATRLQPRLWDSGDAAQRMVIPPRTALGGQGGPRRWWLLRREAKVLLALRYFDAAWYLQAYPDLIGLGHHPVWHWLTAGWKEGRQPNPLFDPRWYLTSNPDVAAAGVNPLMHYIAHGAAEGRDPGPLFSSAWYREHNPDVAAAGLEPLAHYLRHGAAERRAPHPLIDPAWYLDRNPDVAESACEPVQHYLLLGGFEGRDPGPAFHSARYLSMNPDVAAAGMNPLLHYLAHGRREGRRGGPERIAAAAKKNIPPRVPPEETFKGSIERRPDLPNIAVFAHVVSGQIFGGERSFIDVLAKLRHVACNVHVVLPRRHDDYIAELLPHAVEVCCIAYPTWSADQREGGAVAAIRAWLISRRIDLVHVNTIVARAPHAAARRLGIPTATHVRESVLADRWLSERIGLAPDQIIKTVLAETDYVIANSQHSAAEFHKEGHTFVVPNSFDVGALDLPNDIDPRCIRIGLISSNIPKKGIEDFAALANACAQRIPNLRFLLIGPQTEHVRALQAAQEDGRIAGNLEFVDYQPSPAEAISRINIIANLSLFAESFGRTVAEGLAARRPALVYDLGAAKDLVAHGSTGFVCPVGRYQDAIPLLEQLCAQPARIVEMGEAGRAFIVEHYAREAVAASLARAYEAMLRERSPRAAHEDIVVPARRHGLAHRPQPLRLAYFCWHFPVPSETFVLNELRVLVARGVDVEVYCRQSPHPEFAPDFPIRWQRVDSPGELADRLKQSDRTLVHAHFTFPTVTEMVWPACKQVGIPFTFIAHAQDIFKHENDRRNRVGEVAQSPLCRAVFVLGAFHRDYLLERGVPEEKLVVNPNAVDLSAFAYSAPRRLQSGAARRICAIHRFTEKKGLHDLIAAAALLRDEDIEFNLYGYGEELQRLQALVEQQALSHVHFRGALPGGASVAKVLREHDLFACPSVRTASGDMDGIPTAMVEAMASGTPVIATAISGIPDLVRDGLNGILVQPGDPASLADGIRRFFAMPPTTVQALSRNARRDVERRHDARRLVGVLERIWRQDVVDIVIVSWNNLPQLREVVERVFRFTRTPFHLSICDNASDAQVVAYLCGLQEAHDNVTVTYRPRNTFVGPGTNAAACQGIGRYIIYLCGKEGFVLSEGWETELVDYMERHPRVGLGGTLCYSPSYLTGRDYPRISEFARFRNAEFAAANPDRLFSHIQGGLFIWRRRTLDEIGGFSVDVPHAYTDVEYSYYVESCGWQLGAVEHGMLALYNKTRPDIWSRIDEDVRVIHPPRLQDLPLLDQIARGAVRFCNVCGWNGASFMVEAAEPVCPGCGSRPRERSLYRLLAEGPWTYRGLVVATVGVHACLDGFLSRAFRHRRLDSRAAAEDVGEACLDLILHCEPPSAEEGLPAALCTARDGLKAGGTLIYMPDGRMPSDEESDRLALGEGFDCEHRLPYASSVVEYAPQVALICRKHSDVSASDTVDNLARVSSATPQKAS